MKTYNIMFVRNDFKLHGPGMHALNFAIELQARGHKVIFCGAIGELDSKFEEYGFKKITIDGLSIENRKNKLFSNAKQLRKVFIEENIDVVIGWNAFSTITAIVANVFRKKILFLNCVVGEGKERLLKFIPCKYIVVSEYAYNRLREHGISGSRLHIVYPSTINLKKYEQYKVSANTIRDEFGIKDEDVLVVSVAMFVPYDSSITKGQMHIVNTLPKILKGNDRIKFLFVGDGLTRKEVEHRAKELGIIDKVIFAGKRLDVPSIMFAADIFCHYPDQETFGMVTTEAMAAYTPVVARDIGGISHIVDNGKSGYLASNLDVFAEKIVALSMDEDLRKKLGINGRRLVEEKYTLERVIDKLEKVIEKEI